jgi:hypothetical protein
MNQVILPFKDLMTALSFAYLFCHEASKAHTPRQSNLGYKKKVIHYSSVYKAVEIIE